MLWVCVRPGPPNLTLQYQLAGNEALKLDVRVTTLQPERRLKNQIDWKIREHWTFCLLNCWSKPPEVTYKDTPTLHGNEITYNLCARTHTHTPVWHMSTCSTCTLRHMDRAQVAQHIYLLPPHTLPWDNIHISPHLGGAAGGHRCENERIPALENVVGPKSVPFVSQRGMESWIRWEVLRSAGIGEEVLTVKRLDDMKVLKV